jgi:hypothetical protein
MGPKDKNRTVPDEDAQVEVVASQAVPKAAETSAHEYHLPTVALFSSFNQPPSFAGKRDEDVERFLHKADNFFKRLNISPAQHALYLGDWLKAEAENWYLTLDTTVQNNYPALVRELKDRFNNNKNRVLRKIELSNRVQATGESVDTYSVAFLRLMKRIEGMSQEDQTEAFQRGCYLASGVRSSRTNPTISRSA